MTYVVDTHVLVWFLEGSPRLSPAVRDALRDASVEVVIPTIVLAEVAFLYARKRIGVDLNAVLAHIAAARNCVVYPLDETVVERLPPRSISMTPSLWRPPLSFPTCWVWKACF